MSDDLVAVLAEALRNARIEDVDAYEGDAEYALAALDAHPDLVLARLVERGVLREREVDAAIKGTVFDPAVAGDRVFVAQQEAENND